METEKLYYQDAYLRTFSAVVMDCQPASDGWRVVLDRTAFYPEGGGQPGDTGALNDVEVWDTHEEGWARTSLHRQPLPVGERVTGQIHWARRFDHMQQHSGEHIVSGLIHAQYGYDNVGFHLGADLVTIDLNGILDEAQPSWRPRPIRPVWADTEPDHLARRAQPTTAPGLPQQKELSGAVRIVTFPGPMLCACCGTMSGVPGDRPDQAADGPRSSVPACGWKWPAASGRWTGAQRRRRPKPPDLCALS